jgi:hypothetical protein
MAVLAFLFDVQLHHPLSGPGNTLIQFNGRKRYPSRRVARPPVSLVIQVYIWTSTHGCHESAKSNFAIVFLKPEGTTTAIPLWLRPRSSRRDYRDRTRINMKHQYE